MPFASLVGVFGVLALVLGLLVLTLRWLRRFVPRTGGSGTLTLEVLARLPLGPRQGIAVVRIGGRRVAVSVGDGGVRTLLELDTDADAPVVSSELPAVTAVPSTGFAALPGNFAGQFRKAMSGVLGAIAIATLLGASLGARTVDAQQPAAKAAATTAASKPAAATTTAKPTAAATAANVKPAAAAKNAAKGAAKPAGKNAKGTPKAAAVAATAKTGTLAVARVDSALPTLAPRIDLSVGDAGKGGLRLSGTVGVVVMMGLLTLLPMLVLMMTGFTRILIVLSFLRQAIGAQNAPPTQLLAGLALLLTGFVMAPTLEQVNKTALEPWMDGKMEQAAMLQEGVKPFRAFMLRQVRESDLASFMAMSRMPQAKTPDDVPIVVLTSAFVTSELRTAFQVGFALFLPFIVIDVVVASVLMSMGMMMVPPAMIALPFKLLLFVMVDGWTLVIQGLVQGFRP
ncbi:MAG: flagellar type III secretion system pore protein FliP [Gemmatimonadetes bacterium]|nr:flagellar type III secretion system pore protein FliP [Gemmatimonadota bacterium]